eukprot:3018007-Ditylum_brightwellii.AAC.1
MDQAAHTQETFMEYLRKQLEHIKCMLGNLYTSKVDTDYWIKSLNSGRVTIGTDGLVADRSGYYATVLCAEDRTLSFQGPCNGAADLMTTYRTEVAGILEALYLLCVLSQFLTTEIIQQELLDNNVVAVLRVKFSTPPGIKSYITADFDALSEIYNVKASGTN